MSPIREWLFVPLQELESRIVRETGRHATIEVTVDEHTFLQAVSVADIRFGVIGTEKHVAEAIRLGDFIVIKRDGA